MGGPKVIAVIGVTRLEARSYANENQFPHPRHYLGLREDTREDLEGLNSIFAVVTPDALGGVDPEFFTEVWRQITMSSGNAMTFGSDCPITLTERKKLNVDPRSSRSCIQLC